MTVNRSRCICGAAPGERHDLRCIVPASLVESHRYLWAVLDSVPYHPTDDTLESCNRAALTAWIRSGRVIA